MESAKNKIPYTNKYINGETVSYTLSAFFSVFILIAVKQICKIFIGTSAAIGGIAGLILSGLALYLLERRFVFRKNVSASNARQLIALIVRIGADFGFYKLAELVFNKLLDMPIFFAWLIAIAISFFFNYIYDRVLMFDCNYNASEIRQSRIYKTFFRNRYVVFSAAMTAAAIAVIYIAYSVFPFGDATIMRMDLYHQYGPLLQNFMTES